MRCPPPAPEQTYDAHDEQGGGCGDDPAAHVEKPTTPRRPTRRWWIESALTRT